MIEQIKLGDDVISFKDNPSQRSYISTLFNDDLTVRTDNNFKQFVFFGGYRAGKSFIQQLCVFLICSLYPNTRALYVRNTYDELKDSVIQQFNSCFKKYGQYDYIDHSKDGSRIARFKNGSEIRFRSADEPTKLLSNEYDLIALCQAEALPIEVVNILFGRWSGTRLPKKLLLMEGNPAPGWVKINYKDKGASELSKIGVHFQEVNTYENLHNIDPDYINDCKKQLSEIDFRRFIMGEWAFSEGQVFSEYRESKHVIPYRPPGKHEQKRNGLDYGWVNPTCILWGYLDYDQRLIIYDEFYKSQQTADQIYNASLKHPKFGDIPTVADYSIKSADRDGKSLWDDLTSYGMILIESNKDGARNRQDTNLLFKQDRLLICENCVNLISEIPRSRFKAPRIGQEVNAPEEVIKKDDHAVDTLLYLSADLEELHSREPRAVPEHMTLKFMTQQNNFGFSFENYG